MTSSDSHYPEALVEVVADALEAAYQSGLTFTPGQAKEHDARSVLAALARHRALARWSGRTVDDGRFTLAAVAGGEPGEATLQLDGLTILTMGPELADPVAELLRRSQALYELEWRLTAARRHLDETRPHLLGLRGQLGKTLAAQLLEWEIGVQQLVGGTVPTASDAAMVKTPWD